MPTADCPDVRAYLRPKSHARTHPLPRGAFPDRHRLWRQRRAGAQDRNRRARLRPRGAQQPLGGFAPALQCRLWRQIARRLHAVIAFFEERRGRLYGFRWRDRADWKSCAPGATPAATDQAIGTGDGATTAFQLVKTYGAVYAPWTRTIAKPVAGSVLVAVDGAPLSEGWSCRRHHRHRDLRRRHRRRARRSPPAMNSTFRCASTATRWKSISRTSPPATFRRSRWWKSGCRQAASAAD